MLLEPISKSPEQDGDGCKLDKAEKVRRIILRSDQEATLPSKPRKESLHDPASLVSAQAPSVLRFPLPAVGFMWSNHLDALLSKLHVERIAVVGAITDQIVRLGFDHVEVEAQLHECDLMVVGRVRADRQRQTMPINDRHDFHAFSALGLADLIATACGRGKRRIDEALRFVHRSLIAKRVGQISQYGAQHFVSALVLKATMYRLIVGITLRQHVPLRAGVQNPQYRFEDFARRDRLAAGRTIRNIFLRKVFSYPFPLLVAQIQHAS